MTLGYTEGKTKIKIFLMIFALLGISSFTAFELRKVVIGPELTLNCEKEVENKNCNYIKSENNIYKISGKTKNVSDIIIGDRKIFIDTDGNFTENLVLYPGINLITIRSLDKYGRETKRDVSIYYKGINLSMAK
jgi:hypothetical protein